MLRYKDAYLYIQMELGTGTLSKWLANSANEERDYSRMKEWFTQIVLAVGFIHSQGMFHRDLKPSNIVFTDANTLKICDLGISTDQAKQEYQEISKSRTCDRGTVKYMAPEQCGFFGYYSSKVDIFSLGLILVELFVAMSNNEATEVFDNYRRGRPNTILSHLPEIEELVNWMTTPIDTDRPDCEKLINHPFFAETLAQKTRENSKQVSYLDKRKA